MYLQVIELLGAAEWETVPSKPTPTVGHSLISVGDFIYAIGGINSQGEAVNKVEVYDTKAKTWTTKANMITPRGYLATFYQSGSIYAVGGLDNNWYSLDINEKYDIETNTWKSDIPLNHKRSSLVAVSNKGNSYAIGGIDIGISEVKGYNEAYDDESISSDFEFTIGNLEDEIFFMEATGNANTNYYVDWGDGTQSETITSSKTLSHAYTEIKDYKVRFIGTPPSAIKINTRLLKSIDKCDIVLGDIDRMLMNCQNLQSIPADMFLNSPSLTSAQYVFFGCYNLKSIPSNLFSNNINITTFESVFQDTGITSVPANLFQNNTKAVNFKNCFNGCTDLQSVGVQNATNITDLTNIFKECSSLTSFGGFLDEDNNPTLKIDFDISDCVNLTRESVLNISNSLVTMTAETIKNLTLSSESLNLLTEDEKRAIKDKYWNLVGWVENE